MNNEQRTVNNEERTVNNEQRSKMACLSFFIFLFSLFFCIAGCKLGDGVEAPVYTVVYNANGGSGTMGISSHVYGAAKNLNTNAFTRTGYTFRGWAESPEDVAKYTNGQSVKNLTKKDGATVTLYAVWSRITLSYTVVYNANGGSGAMANSTHVYGEDQDLAINAFTNNDYIFAGWAESPEGPVVYMDGQSVINLTETAGATITLYAVWGRGYIVAYNANGGTGIMVNSSIIFGASQNLRTNTFVRTGYTFAGWATSASGPVVYTDEQNVSNLSETEGDTILLFAVWTANNYRVVYNANGGGGIMANSSFIYDETQNLRQNAFFNPGYIFAGWSTSASGPVVYTDGQNVSNLTSEAGATITLYAVWYIPDVPGSNLAAKLAWLQTNAVSNADYTIEVNANESISPHALAYSGRNNIGITLISTGTERIIGLSSNGSLFTVQNGVTLILDNNITLQGQTGNNNSLVRVNSGGTLVMNMGSSIRGNTSTPNFGGGVHVRDGATFVMNGGEISGNTATAGGGVNVGENGTFMMQGGKITDNTSPSGAGIHVRGTFTMQGGIISDNTSSNHGGGVYMSADGGTFTMNGGEISNNRAIALGGGVLVYGSGTFTMNDGMIFGCNATNGGGVCAESGTFIMNNGKILGGNSAVYGGGVYAGTTGSFTMYDGEISGNIATKYGGGVFLTNQSDFTMSSGKITENTATDSGGGVYVENKGIVTMHDGEISGNTATHNGGGVFVDSNSTFTMHDGEISGGNTANGGGGVTVRGTFIMYDGKIFGNTANIRGAGVDVYDGTFTMHGGEISGNIATINGGGVYVFASGALFTMYGGEIFGNTANSNGGGVHVENGTFRIVTGTIYGSDETDTSLKNTATTSGAALYKSDNGTVQYGTYNGNEWKSNGNLFTSEETIRVVNGVLLGIDRVFNVGNTTQWNTAVSTITAGGNDKNYIINVTADFSVTGSTANTFGSVSEIIVILQGAGRILTLSGNGNMLRIANNQNVILQDVTLRGHGSNDNTVVYVSGTNSIFTMTSGSISGNRVTTGSIRGGGLHVRDGASFTMNGGVISGNTATEFGGGVYVEGGPFTMSGGEISGNTASSYGGGVCVEAGTFIMKNGRILGNNSPINGGGVYVGSETSFTMNGGEIGNNNASNGGGVNVGGYATFKMDGGNISGNNATNSGGGVDVGNGATFEMNHGNISGNNATNDGGGVYVESGTTFWMNGGEISGGNRANGGGGVSVRGNFGMYGGKISGNTGNIRGGGVYVWSGYFAMHGGEISGNTSSTYGDGRGGAGVCLYEGGIFDMHNGTISGNTTEGDGGGIHSDKGTFTMNGGIISGNTSTHYTGGGGGVWVNNGGTFNLNGGKIANNRTTSAGGGGVHVNGNNSTFIMKGGEIAGNATPTNRNGGGVYVNSGTFYIVTGTIYGSNDPSLSNTASSGASFYRGGGTAQRGTFSGTTWNSSGNLSTTNNTIRVVNGNLQ